MKNEKIILPVGNSKALVYEISTGDKEELEFIKQCEAVAATKPGTIQDFFMRLNSLQKNQRKKSKRI
jgi:hypothetical protein